MVLGELLAGELPFLGWGSLPGKCAQSWGVGAGLDAHVLPASPAMEACGACVLVYAVGCSTSASTPSVTYTSTLVWLPVPLPGPVLWWLLNKHFHNLATQSPNNNH